MGLPLLIDGHIKYVNIPIGCKLYDKSKTKLELASEVIGAARVDTALYELPPPPTGKKSRPRKRGEKIDYKNLSYIEEESAENLLHSTVQCLTNLIEKLVYVTYTTTNTGSFSSVRLYISTIPLDTL